jgi:class 3 adenylate cyclase
MSETRKIAAILVSDAVGYSRLAGADEDRALARLRAVRSDLIDPIIAVHHGPANVIAAAPDLILASWCGKKVVPDKIRQRPGWNAIPGFA